MLLDEQGLRQQLAAAADQAGAPHVTVAAVTRRIRRRRARIIGLASGVVAAVAAVAVAVPVAVGRPGAPPPGHPPPALFRLSLTVTVNGHTRVFPKNGPPPAFTVTPGEHLRIRVGVDVPVHHEVTTLWLGVAKVLSAPGRDGQPPSGMRPVLAHTRKPLTLGPHTFTFTWTVTARLPHGTSVLLAAEWTTKEHDASVGQPVAEFVTPP